MIQTAVRLTPPSPKPSLVYYYVVLVGLLRLDPEMPVKLIRYTCDRFHP